MLFNWIVPIGLWLVMWLLRQLRWSLKPSSGVLTGVDALGLPDNAYRTEADPVDSSRFILSPTVNWVADKGLTKLTAQYSGSYASADESNLDYADHSLEFAGQTEFSKRSRAQASLGFSFSHEDAGTYLSRGLAQGLDELTMRNEVQLNLEHTYGVQTARGNIVTGLDYRDFDYSNNSQLTDGAGQSQLSPYVDFSLRISGDSRGFLRLRHTTYSADLASRDGSALEASLGLKWDISGRSGGQFTLGQSTRSFDSGADDQSTAVYGLTAFFNPRDFSRFQVTALREFAGITSSVASFQGQDSISDQLRFRWDYDWSSRFSHTAMIFRDSISRECPDQDTDRVTAELEINLAVRRWLSFGAGISTESRSTGSCSEATDTQGFDFDRQQFSVYTRVTL